MLTPQETDKLFAVIRNMKADGKAVVIITHKLHEVLTISDRVAILRRGEYVGDVATKDANEAMLTELMVGKKVELDIERPQPDHPHQASVGAASQRHRPRGRPRAGRCEL